jgi:hypothetical protein
VELLISDQATPDRLSDLGPRQFGVGNTVKALAQ